MIVGIDPGISGGAAALSGCTFIDVIDLPTIKAGKKREIDVIRLYRWLYHIKPHRIVLENVHSMPRDGVVAAFGFGVSVGMIKAMCRMWTDTAVEYVEPIVWKEYFDLIGGDKEASRLRALQIFPEAADFLERKRDHQRAEAMLIAAWAVRPPIGRDW